DFDESQREECTNKLGNLMLISRRKNASLSNYDFSVKKERYFKSNVGSFALSFKIYGTYQTWTYAEFTSNHNDILDMLIDYFKL
ncbi:MAG: HNH endonuclease, partial [Ruminococcus sp.]|nr:HNH endonuclease [Ruminococcus sp.]